VSIWFYGGVFQEPNHHVWWSSTCTFCKAEMNLLHRQMDDISTLKTRGSYEKRVFVCPVCGWWKADGRRDIDDWVHQARFQSLQGAAASLRELDLADVATPIEEVRSYLAGQYDKRATLHPRLFEETIASVFRSLGYAAEVTAYSGDGGIDVILQRGNETIGVQAKRYKDKNTVEVEQIRSLAGALVLNGFTRGMFITTSGFQSGGERTAAKYKTRGYEIELVDAPRFYEALKLAQRDMYCSFEEFPVADVLNHLATLDDYVMDTRYTGLEFNQF
jgi:restriction system protein